MQKYNLPSNHELFLERTIDDLELEFWVDYYDANPLEAHRNADGEIQFHHPDDDLFNKWEEQIAKGEKPDLSEAFDVSSLEKLSVRAKRKKANPDKGMSFKEVTEMMEREQGPLERRISRHKHLQPSAKTFGHGLED